MAEGYALPVSRIAARAGSTTLIAISAVLLVATSWTTPAFAGGSNQVHAWAGKSAAGSGIKSYMVNLNLGITDEGDGWCPDGYADQCPSGNCYCLLFTGKGSGNRVGKVAPGNVIAEMTLDLDNQPGDPDGTCYPTYGVLELVGSKDGAILDFMGATCEDFGNPNNPGVLRFFNGGFAFDQPSSIFYDGAGSAQGKTTASGVKLKLKGKASTVFSGP
jgi:hypothetical protein